MQERKIAGCATPARAVTICPGFGMLRDSIIIIDQYVTIALDMAQCKHAPHACPQICANRVLRSIHGR